MISRSAIEALKRDLSKVWDSNEELKAIIHNAAIDEMLALDDDPEHSIGARYRIEHDGFQGTVIGHYKRLDGYEGVVMQQDGTKVVHVYGVRWLKALLLREAAMKGTPHD